MPKVVRSQLRLRPDDPLYLRFIKYRRPEPDKCSDRYVWDEGLMLGLADDRCSRCGGMGKLPRLIRRDISPCGCVLRRIFRICLARWEYCKLNSHVSVMRMDRFARGGGRYSFGRKQEEYIADFELLLRHALTEQELDVLWLARIWRMDVNGICRRMGLDRGAAFRILYRAEEKAGRAFIETRPYGIYPLDEYFGGRVEHKIDDQAADAIMRQEERPKVMRAAS
jgi:predicted DNA-binding protein (UPF0251 family)